MLPLCVLCTLSIMVSLYSQLHLHELGGPPGSLVPLPELQPGNFLPRQVAGGDHRTPLVCLLSLIDHNSSLPDAHCLEN